MRFLQARRKQSQRCASTLDHCHSRLRPRRGSGLLLDGLCREWRPGAPVAGATVFAARIRGPCRQSGRRARLRAFRVQVLHRDIKPSNIMLESDEPRLADFGLATQLENRGDLTSASGVFGTPHYLAPEALRGGAAKLTAASDLYALGTVSLRHADGKDAFCREHRQRNCRPWSMRRSRRAFGCLRRPFPLILRRFASNASSATLWLATPGPGLSRRTSSAFSRASRSSLVPFPVSGNSFAGAPPKAHHRNRLVVDHRPGRRLEARYAGAGALAASAFSRASRSSLVPFPVSGNSFAGAAAVPSQPFGC